MHGRIREAALSPRGGHIRALARGTFSRQVHPCSPDTHTRGSTHAYTKCPSVRAYTRIHAHTHTRTRTHYLYNRLFPSCALDRPQHRRRHWPPMLVVVSRVASHLRSPRWSAARAFDFSLRSTRVVQHGNARIRRKALKRRQRQTTTRGGPAWLSRAA